jgi:hypothetical protein
MKLGFTRLIGAGFVLVGGGLLWLVSDEIFLGAGARSSAGGEAVATAVGILIPGLMFLIFGESIWKFYSKGRATRVDYAIIVVGLGVAVVLPVVLFDWVALFGHGSRVEAEAEASPIDPEARNFLEEAAQQRRDAELSIRRALEQTGGKDPSNAAQPPAR